MTFCLPRPLLTQFFRQVNYCVRWESGTAVTEAQRNQIATVLQAQHDKWMQWLIGFDKFPYSSVPVKVMGWAVRDKNLLQGSTSGIDVYTNQDSGGIPECNPACGRFFHQDNNYGSCPGGAARHYDVSLWLTDGFSGGAGGDWGQRIGREYFMGALGTANIHILLHEMVSLLCLLFLILRPYSPLIIEQGHTYALDDCKSSARPQWSSYPVIPPLFSRAELYVRDLLISTSYFPMLIVYGKHSPGYIA